MSSTERSTAAALVASIRPRQWIKNVLVFAAPLAAGQITEPSVFVDTTAAAITFCAVASGIYLINDVLDRHIDRSHPTKRRRPIAAGELSVGIAVGAAIALIALGIGLGTLVRMELGIVLATYVTLAVLYSAGLKGVPVVELMIVASGFLLRAIGGGAATGIPLSDWFLIVASFGSLFMVAGKRRVELDELGAEAGAHRPVLARYPVPFVRMVETISASVAVAAYVLWAFERAAAIPAGVWFKLSIAPFVLGILYYALLVETGAARAPEDVIMRERVLQAMAVALVVLIAAGVYAG